MSGFCVLLSTQEVLHLSTSGPKAAYILILLQCMPQSLFLLLLLLLFVVAPFAPLPVTSRLHQSSSVADSAE